MAVTRIVPEITLQVVSVADGNPVQGVIPVLGTEDGLSLRLKPTNSNGTSDGNRITLVPPGHTAFIGVDSQVKQAYVSQEKIFPVRCALSYPPRIISMTRFPLCLLLETTRLLSHWFQLAL